ncbi:MAG: hypothetical protein LQ344_004670 [Seirophora lacunosa]|nr:MAG: hypothetical protein LQ344_004670 [Seirophora lacunosa]
MQVPTSSISSFVDREFENLLKQRMRSRYESLPALLRQQAIKKLRGKSKWLSGDDAEPQDFHVDLPIVVDIHDAGVRSGKFPHFAASWRGPAGPLIRILQHREASTAIVRGTVIKAMEKAGFAKIEIMWRARRWYGVTVNEPFVEGKHRAEDRCVNARVWRKIKSNWFIQKDQIMVQLYTGPSATSAYRPPHVLRLRLPAIETRAPLPAVAHLCTINLEPLAPGQEGLPVAASANGAAMGISSVLHLVFLPRQQQQQQPCRTARNNNLTFALEFRGQRYGLANVGKFFEEGSPCLMS